MQELTGILKDATAAIEPIYFLLEIAGGSSIYRERVYCYELYHQLRCRWPSGCPFYVNGEVDKSGHPEVAKLRTARVKPDLLIHRPGDMKQNHAIIEVKNTRSGLKGVRKDLATLSNFRGSFGYQRAIYLLYGSEGSLSNRVRKLADELPQLPPIELWLHTDPGRSANCVARLGRPQPESRRTASF